MIRPGGPANKRAKVEPERFARLSRKLPSDANPAYMDRILAAIQDATLPTKLKLEVCRKAFDESCDHCSKSITDVLGRIEDPLPDDAVDRLLATHYVCRSIGNNLSTYFAELRPIIERMLRSAESEVCEAGARLASLAALHHHHAADIVDEALRGGPQHRRGVAKIAANNVVHSECRDWCEAKLVKLFDDEDADVRRNAALCFSHVHFDFSAFDDTLETLRERFEYYCFQQLRHALECNPDLFSAATVRRILAAPTIDTQLNELFLHTRRHGIPLYVLIDEYDNFANTILACRGSEAYHSFTHGGGFYRNFFATLKAGAGYGSGIERLFVTGVSPITMDDVTSGFNIGANLSLRPEFNELLGFTEAEVRAVLERYRRHGVFDQDVDQAMAVMGEWYNGYRFAAGAPNDLYNTDLVLYYLKWSIPNRPPPDDPIDRNIRIDYGKLRHLLTVNQRLNGNFDLLLVGSHIKSLGKQGICSD